MACVFQCINGNGELMSGNCTPPCQPTTQGCDSFEGGVFTLPCPQGREAKTEDESQKE